MAEPPVVIGKKADTFCVSFEDFAFHNLGYSDHKELGPGEVWYAALGIELSP